MNNSPLLQRLMFLYQAARTLSSSLDTDKVLQMMMTMTQQHYQPDAVSVALVDTDGSLVFRAASGKSAQHVLGLRMPSGMGVVGWVAQHGQTLWVPDTRADERHCRKVDEESGFVTRSIYAAPVRLGDQILAVLEIINPAPDTPLQDLEEVVLALAALAAPAIQNARLFEKVRRAEERYQRLFELTLDPIIILDKNGALLHVNRAGQHLFDILPARPGQSLLDILAFPQELPKTRQHLDGSNMTTWEMSFETPEGNPCVYEMTLAYLASYPPDGAYQVLAHDITDRAALQHMRELLSTMIVHDLRNPLNSITYGLELIRSAWMERETSLPVDQIVKIGLRSARRMDLLISDILDAARLPHDQTLSVSHVPVAELMQEAIETVQPAAIRRDHQITGELPESLPPLEGDVDLLRRVLINILSNAIKFTPKDGYIHLRVVVDGQEFVFSVSDNGPGIPLEEQEQIFAPFFQGRGAPGGKERGVGLGLAFCKLAIEAHHGRIWLESEVGKGSTFYFAIPRILPDDVKRRETELLA